MAPRIPLFSLLGPSPIKPIEMHMNKAFECAEALLPFFDAAMAKDWESANEKFQTIARLEFEADELKRDLRLHLHKDLYLPVERGDLLILLMLQDRVANKTKDIAGLVLSRQMDIPVLFRADYLQLLKHCIDAVAQARRAINELDELLEAGFRGKEVNLVQQMLLDLDSIERETDEQQREIRKKLFHVEKDLHPMDCIAFYKLIEWTGALADRAETVGGQLQILLAN